MPPDIQALVELAAQVLGVYADPSEADGNCGLSCDYFFDIIDEVMPEAQAVELCFSQDPPPDRGDSGWFAYNQVPHDWYLGGCGWPGHAVVAVNGWAIDWTARQFDPNAPFPLVFPV